MSVGFKRQREPTTPTEALPDARGRGGPTWVRAIAKPLRVRAPGFEPLVYNASEKKRSGHKRVTGTSLLFLSSVIRHIDRCKIISDIK